MAVQFDRFSIVPVEVFMDDRLTKTDIRVLGAILSWREKNTSLYHPTREQIQERCNLPLCKITASTAHLSEIGWLNKSGNGGRSTAARYELKVPEIEIKEHASDRRSESEKPVPNRVSEKPVPNRVKTRTDLGEKPVPNRVKTRTELVRGNINKVNKEEINTNTHAGACDVVFSFWKETMHKAKAKLDDARKRKIQAALKNYSVDDLKLSITGCSLSPFHMGENDKGTLYNDIKTIFRDSSQIEKFIDLASSKQATLENDQYAGFKVFS